MSSGNNKLVYMANQIGKFFQNEGEESAVKNIAIHIKKFWDPRMLKAIYAHLEAGGAGLDPFPLKALEQLRQAALQQS
jgi:formate dehydrogenase subunit delta